MRKITEKQEARQFSRMLRINLNRNHSRNIEQRAESAHELICDLVIHGKLDAVDLKIIAARDCSPMPTQEEVAKSIGLSRPAVMKRVARFQRLFVGI